jgi:UPF0755 protein
MKIALRLAALLAVLSVAAMAGRLALDAALRAPGPSAAATTLVLPKGKGTAEIGRLLAQAGVIERPVFWPILVKLSGRQPLQAGEYEFPARASPAQILDLLRRGQVVVHRLTIAEGLTVLQVKALLQGAAGAVGGVDKMPAEGRLAPSTYFYLYGEERDALVARMQKGMSDLLDEAWAGRRPDPLLPDKEAALTLASIVERETALPEERPHVAAVFLNRLRLHMRLQSDPTVIYAVSRGEGVLDRPLSHADLAVDSPYNSYAVDGLPPGPICNPGRASLMAVLHPLASDDLYFVADGSGGHAFAKSLAEHNRNVARLRRVEQGAEPPPAQRR